MTNKLEALLRKAGRELMDHQVARIFKVPEEMTQTPCDFFGYEVGGRAILIEAKMVERPALPVGNSPGLRAHQWNELLDAHRAGALALIAWSRGNVCKVIDMALAVKLSEGRASIPWSSIDDQYARPMDGPKAHLGLLKVWMPDIAF